MPIALLFFSVPAGVLTGKLHAAEPPAAVDPALVRQAIVAFYQQPPALPHDVSGPWIELIAQAGGPEELRRLVRQVAARDFSIEATKRAVEALAAAATLIGGVTQMSGPTSAANRNF